MAIAILHDTTKDWSRTFKAIDLALRHLNLFPIKRSIEEFLKMQSTVYSVCQRKRIGSLRRNLVLLQTCQLIVKFNNMTEKNIFNNIFGDWLLSAPKKCELNELLLFLRRYSAKSFLFITLRRQKIFMGFSISCKFVNCRYCP